MRHRFTIPVVNRFGPNSSKYVIGQTVRKWPKTHQNFKVKVVWYSPHRVPESLSGHIDVLNDDATYFEPILA